MAKCSIFYRQARFVIQGHLMTNYVPIFHFQHFFLFFHHFLGSKMVPIFSWIQMGKDLLLIRARYVIGAWALEPSGQPNLVDVNED